VRANRESEKKQGSEFSRERKKKKNGKVREKNQESQKRERERKKRKWESAQSKVGSELRKGKG